MPCILKPQLVHTSQTRANTRNVQEWRCVHTGDASSFACCAHGGMDMGLPASGQGSAAVSRLPCPWLSCTRNSRSPQARALLQQNWAVATKQKVQELLW